MKKKASLQVCFVVVVFSPQREAWYTNCSGRKKKTLVYTLPLHLIEKEQENHCALCNIPLKVLLSTEASDHLPLHSIKSTLREPAIFSSSLLLLFVHICTLRFSCHWWKKIVWPSYVTSNRKLTASWSQSHQTPRAKSSLCVCCLPEPLNPECPISG